MFYLKAKNISDRMALGNFPKMKLIGGYKMSLSDDMRFAHQWYKEAKSIRVYDDFSKNAIFRFMAFWVAFNSYYGDPFRGSERGNIKYTVKKKYSLLAKYNPFENSSNSLIHHFPVLDAATVEWLSHNPDSPAQLEMKKYQDYIGGKTPILSPTAEQHAVAIKLLRLVKDKFDVYVSSIENGRGYRSEREKRLVKQCSESIASSITCSCSINGPYNVNPPIWSDDDDWAINPVLCTVFTLYQIRCNLFHGSKAPTNTRDFELVKEAADILEGFLDVLFE